LGQISIKIQNRTYRLSCGDGEEQRLLQLAEHVRAKAEQLTAEFGRISEQHMLLMSALLIADELMDERSGGRKDAPDQAAAKSSRSEVAGSPASQSPASQSPASQSEALNQGQSAPAREKSSGTEQRRTGATHSGKGPERAA
jgi:cell division protein ZapA